MRQKGYISPRYDLKKVGYRRTSISLLPVRNFAPLSSWHGTHEKKSFFVPRTSANGIYKREEFSFFFSKRNEKRIHTFGLQLTHTHARISFVCLVAAASSNYAVDASFLNPRAALWQEKKDFSTEDLFGLSLYFTLSYPSFSHLLMARSASQIAQN